MSRRNRDQAAQQAASEAGRILQQQRQQAESADALEPAPEPEAPKNEKIGVTPELRNEPRRMAMEEIERRDMESKGLTEPAPKAELPPEPPVPTPEDMLKGDKFAPHPEATPQPETVSPPVPEPLPSDSAAVVAPVETVRVKVDGEEFDAPKAEVEEAGGIRAYQREKAAENRLKKTNEALAETRRTQAALVEFLQKQYTPPAAPEKTPDQFFAEKIDVIRFGSPEESAAALREVIERSNPRIDQEAVTQKAVSKMQQALATTEFQNEFQDIVANPLTLKLAVTLENERVAQMQQAGHTPNWSAFYKQIGNEVRSVMGQRQSQPTTTPAANAPTTGTPSQVSSDKEARKASIVNLPTASQRAALPAESKPETREDILNEMRKKRGIPIG